jgi:hypothetical protein
MYVKHLNLEDLAELEPAENMTDVTLRWEFGPSIEDVLPIVKRWRHLDRLTLFDNDVMTKISVPPLEVLGDFIMELKQLSHLHIAPLNDGSNYEKLKILRDNVNELILPLRPNFNLTFPKNDF